MVFAHNASKELNVTFRWEVSLVYFSIYYMPDEEDFRGTIVLCSTLSLLTPFNTEQILAKEKKRKNKES